METTNIALEIFSIVISLILLICCLVEVPASKKQTRLFAAMLCINILVLASDMITWIMEEVPENAAVLHVLIFLVFSLGYIMAALFTRYLVSHISSKGRGAKHIVPFVDILCLIAIIMVAVSFFNGMYFRIVDGVYCIGSVYWLSQVFPVGIVLIDVFIVIKYRKVLGFRDAVSLLSYAILPIIAMLIQIWVYGITLLYMATTISLLILYIMIHVDQNRRMQQQMVELSQAKIAIMLSQIQPHFLYNALNSIQCLCHDDPATAEQATADFSDFLRGNMDSLTMDKPISFEQELTHTKHYLALELLRFPDKLTVEYDIQAISFCLPTLTLQPIVENAVRYGVTKKLTGGTVKIATRETDNAFVITVEDTGVGFDPSQPYKSGRTHVGVQNVRDRLARMVNGTLDIQSTLGVGTVAAITIPKEKQT